MTMKLKQFLLLTTVPIFLGMGAVILQTTTTRAQAEVQGNPQLAQAESGDDQGCRERRRPDLGATAQQLGITEAELRDALGLPEEPIALDENGRPTAPLPRPDLAAAAQQLGITEAELRTAMGLPEEGLGRGHHRPDFAAAAQTLGVTEDALKAALGIPERP